MNTKPILFSTPMVQAILEGRKTQTRRIVKQDLDHQCWVGNGEGYQSAPPSWSKEALSTGKLWCGNCGHHAMSPVKCPYGKPGDILYVRETWALTTNVNSLHNWPGRPHLLLEDGYCIIYRADGEWEWVDDDGFSTEKSYWKPSIHMPKSACRIFLRITDIRVERLQDITEEDAIAEGVKSFRPVPGDGPAETQYYHYLKDKWGPSPKHSFQTLWESINGPGSWENNEWLWVVSFERIDKPESWQ